MARFKIVLANSALGHKDIVLHKFTSTLVHNKIVQNGNLSLTKKKKKSNLQRNLLTQNN